MKRQLTAEILDSLPHDDLGAICSRRDLVRVNFFMGNERWALSQIPADTSQITELGAGDGQLIKKIAHQFTKSTIHAYDLAPRPVGLAEKVNWIQGDILKQSPPVQGGVLIANLVLHHFDEAQLKELGRWMRGFDILIFNEPLRSRGALILARFAIPWVHEITRHDMRVSIEAGFQPDELPEAFGFNAGEYRFSEMTDWRGAIRVLGYKD